MAEDFAKAVALHQAGKLLEAVEIYQRILVANPYDEGANHLLGVACSQMGQFDLAIHLISEAIRANDRVPDYHVNLGNALFSVRRLDEAEAAYRRALALNAEIPEALFGLGNTLAQTGQLEEALAFHRNALALRPNFVEALANMAGVLGRLGRRDEAVEKLRRAVAERPGEASLHADLGRALLASGHGAEADVEVCRALRLAPDSPPVLVAASDVIRARGRMEEALEYADRAVELAPNYPPAVLVLARQLRVLGRRDQAAETYLRLAGIEGAGVAHLFDAANALNEMSRLPEAVALYQRLLAREHDHSEVWNNLGNALRELGELERAAECYEAAERLSPDDPVVMSNRAALLGSLGKAEEAEALCRRVVELQPGIAIPLSNLGQALYAQGRMEEAQEQFDAAGAANPENDDVRFHRAIIRLMLGNFAEGWPLYEARWGNRKRAEQLRHAGIPQWLGDEDLQGRTLLLWSEQGFGDTLQFVRFAALAAARGARVILEVQPALVSLLRQMPGIHKVVAVGEETGPVDLQSPLMSLPMAFGTTPDTIPAGIPYLAPPPERLAPWTRRLNASLPSGPRIGLVWAGDSRDHDIECTLIDRRRSLALKQLEPVLAVDGASFVSLQVGKQGLQARDEPRITDLTSGITDFADTAALISGLDLVISVDTSSAHLAAALGKPVWLLSRFDGCWRWMQNRDDSPWYPTLTLYRQPAPGDWDTPLARMAEDLRAWLKTGK
ncbi:TPR repeat-contatining protein [Paramagnetospirillum magnetotacticum MS-1]|uniref:TPR repeat-contatining protein n=1 Tax=Paramagnetospirillum magnetotacticum MS-1 TaxID=272627 RepID=A0A0C2YWS6_PARME|nr:tetratricopeptide repeat protein [Paramagnetospirillum magnetotacticum]KIL99115.1 TPR repeat-contatining protein [Paramagnetospirillum magnetotacticum MS-1]